MMSVTTSGICRKALGFFCLFPDVAANDSDLKTPSTSTKIGEHEVTDSKATFSFTTTTFPVLPTDILRLSFEAAVLQAFESNDDRSRQRSAYAYCLVSKDVKAWVEPALYDKVVLESCKQVMGFLNALDSKPVQFLSRAVKTVWILDNSFPEGEVKRFHRLFTTCLSLEKLVVLGLEPCTRIFQDIPKPQGGPYALRELAIIQPADASVRHLCLSNFSIDRLQIIDARDNFVASLNGRAIADNEFLDELRAIPHIYFDSTCVPTFFFTLWVKEHIIPLLLIQVPESNTVLSLRSGRHPGGPQLKYLHRWVREFDAYIEQCGRRLLVSANPEVGSSQTKRSRKRQRRQGHTGSEPIASELERAKDWIGLE